MKKLLFAIIIIFISGFNYSQTTSFINAEASANLIYPISLKAGAGDLDFGEIILTGLPILEIRKPKNGKEFIIQGQKGRNVTVYFSNVILNNYEWAARFNGKFGRLKFISDVISADNKQLRSGSSIILKSNGTIGEQKIYVGGKIKIRAKQPIGSYRGLFVISVAY